LSETAKQRFLNEMLKLGHYPPEGEAEYCAENPGIIHRNATLGHGSYLVTPAGELVLKAWRSAEYATAESFSTLKTDLEGNLQLL
jgi:hypothetical protein